MVREVKNVAEFNAILAEAGNKLVVVDFTAQWCGPCRRIAPIYTALSEEPENNNVIFLKVDVDEAEELSAACKVSCMPTFQFYKNKDLLEQFSGGDEQQLRNTLFKYRS